MELNGRTVLMTSNRFDSTQFDVTYYDKAISNEEISWLVETALSFKPYAKSLTFRMIDGIYYLYDIKAKTLTNCRDPH